MALPFYEEISHAKDKITDKIGLHFEAWPLFTLGLVLLFLAYVYYPEHVKFALSLALFISPLWLPLLILNGATISWYNLKRSEFIASQNYVLLEIKMPRNVVKTPLAMEAFLSSIHLTGSESTWYQRFTGGVRPYWSLEIASFEGEIHFFIWGRASLRRLVESQIYAQFPGTQVVEAVDYTRTISADPKEWAVWGCEYKNTDKDPLPIKTYIEYGLDKTQKEPEQVDPIANLIEFMGSIGKGEYLWLQYVIRAHKGEKYGVDPGSNVSNKLNANGKPYTWKDEAKEIVEQIRRETRDSYTDVITGEERPGFPNPTKGQSEKMAAMERNVSKLGFDVGIRGIYIANPEHFHGPTIAHLISVFKPFSTEGWNGINSTGWMKKFDDYPWEIGVEKRKDQYRRELVEAYRRRQFFYEPLFEGGLSMHDVMVMSTEELATIYHIPSSTVSTPGLRRIQSATAEAPANLPV